MCMCVCVVAMVNEDTLYFYLALKIGAKICKNHLSARFKGRRFRLCTKKDNLNVKLVSNWISARQQFTTLSKNLKLMELLATCEEVDVQRKWESKMTCDETHSHTLSIKFLQKHSSSQFIPLVDSFNSSFLLLNERSNILYIFNIQSHLCINKKLKNYQVNKNTFVNRNASPYGYK